MDYSRAVLADEHPNTFLCSRRHIPDLTAKAEAEAAQLLKEFSAFSFDNCSCRIICS